MSNALPFSISNVSIPAAPASRPRATFQLSTVAPAFHDGAASGAKASRPTTSAPRSYVRQATLPAMPRLAQPVPVTLSERMILGRERIRAAAVSRQRIRSYEVALDLDMSEFHFARQFRAAFGRSPHVYYDEVRAEIARALLEEGLPENEVARRVGFRRPAEVRNLLNKRSIATSA